MGFAIGIWQMVQGVKLKKKNPKFIAYDNKLKEDIIIRFAVDVYGNTHAHCEKRFITYKLGRFSNLREIKDDKESN